MLVCTYIEDSPEVTNATAMVVEYADMHDLVRLHRLRAHVSNGYRSGSCAFVTSDNPSTEQLERLEQLQGERDGFRLAELDLQYRGASAVLGDRASQAPSFRGLFRPVGACSCVTNRRIRLVRRDPDCAMPVALRRPSTLDGANGWDKPCPTYPPRRGEAPAPSSAAEVAIPTIERTVPAGRDCRRRIPSAGDGGLVDHTSYPQFLPSVRQVEVVGGTG